MHPVRISHKDELFGALRIVSGAYIRQERHKDERNYKLISKILAGYVCLLVPIAECFEKGIAENKEIIYLDDGQLSALKVVCEIMKNEDMRLLGGVAAG